MHAPARRLLALLLLAASGLAATAQAQSLPDGFSDESLIVGGSLDLPTCIAFLPPQAGTQRLLVGEKRGVVWLVTNGVKSSTPVWDGQSKVLDSLDRGLLDIAVDPNFSTNRRVYFLYTVDPDSANQDNRDESYGRLERYQLTTDFSAVVPSSRAVLFGTQWSNGPLIASPSHTVGAVRFGTDGTLLVSIGEGANFVDPDAGGNDPNAFLPGLTNPSEDVGAYRSQLITSLCGKVLRLDPNTGLGLSSNPYWDGNASSVRSRVWAYGLRNPYRFCVRPGTGSTNPADGNPGQLYIGDVGWTTYEEVNVATAPGQNFGWPCREGPQATVGYSTLPQNQRWLCDSLGTSRNPATSFKAPAIYYHHDNTALSTPPGYTGNTATGGMFYTGTGYPASYLGKYFAPDFGSNFIRLGAFDAAGAMQSFVTFGTGINGPVDIAPHPENGDIVYVSIYTNTVRRIRYNGGTSGNQPPVVVAGATPTVGSAPLAVQFSSAGTFDPDADVLAYAWSFGDGNASTSANPSHTYTQSGGFTATLVVDDGHGHAVVDSVSIFVSSQTNTFPTTGILDDFNRADGPIGGLWVDDTAGLRIVGNQLALISGTASSVLSSPVLGPTQEAYLTLSQITPGASEHNLMLKVQGLSWSAGHVEAHYDATQNAVFIGTYDPGQGWIARGSVTGVTFAPGDQFGVRAYANGTVEVFHNGISRGQVSLGNWPSAALGGRVGLTISNAASTRLDDYGGGNAVLNTNTPPTATILTPGDLTFFSVGDTIRLTCSASDAQQSDTTLAYRWDVDLHHNNHVHPGVATFLTRTGWFVAENHDDGTGVHFEIRVKATDSGGLAGADTVNIYPAIDLTPGALTTSPVAPNDQFPTTLSVRLRNAGTMPAPRSRWRMLLDGALLAEGDTLVAAGDSVEVIAVTPAPLGIGPHAVRVVADTLAAVPETDESNNARNYAFDVVHVALDTPPTVSITAPLNGAFHGPTDSIHVACLAMDAEEPDTLLSYRWTVDRHVGATLDTSIVVILTRMGQFEILPLGGSGDSLSVRVRVTDAGGLGATDVVRIHPSVDLEVSAFTDSTAQPHDVAPTTFRARVSNLGSMPSRRVHWQLLVDGVSAAQGDTAFAGHEILDIDATTPGPLALGLRSVRFVIDTTQVQYEIREDNNAITRTFLVTPGTTDTSPGIQGRLALSAPYPNPARGDGISLSLSLPEPADVRFDVLDVQGRMVWSGGSTSSAAGQRLLRWNGRTADGRDLPAGVYLARVQVGTRVLMRRFLQLQ